MQEEVKAQIVLRMQENLPRIEKCLNLLSEEHVWQKPNEASNSIANLILHLCGNITQYIQSSMGHQPDHRTRDEEFSTTSGLCKKELYIKIETTINEACEIIEACSIEELERRRNVQGFNLTGIGCAIHACEHLSYHVGQIALITKLITNKDLEFYDGQNLNTKNELT